jgi:hypothetical protein
MPLKGEPLLEFVEKMELFLKMENQSALRLVSFCNSYDVQWLIFPNLYRVEIL